MNRSRLAWALLVGALAATVAIAAFVVIVVRQRADASRDEEIALWQATASIDRLSALEWQAIGDGGVSDEVNEGVVDARTRLIGAMRDIASPNEDSDEGRLSKLASEYSAAVLDEIAAIEAGDIDLARQLDEETVDPLYAALSVKLTAEASNHHSNADKGTLIADLATMLALVATSALTFTLTMRARIAEPANGAPGRKEGATRTPREAARTSPIRPRGLPAARSLRRVRARRGSAPCSTTAEGQASNGFGDAVKLCEVKWSG